MTALRSALWWEPAGGSAVFCRLCPHECRIACGQFGFCGVRQNIGGELFSLSYGHPVALQVDPIEKKPLAEFMPGTKTFSLGTYGCNLSCSFCQNHHLSRGHYRDAELLRPPFLPESLVRQAEASGSRSIAFTYNEPIVMAEYVIDIAAKALSAGLGTVLVSNGFINSAPAADLFPLIQAANIDIKGFSEDFYREMTGGSLAPVCRAALEFHRGGGHLELTTLLIPGKNDSPEMIGEYLAWVLDELGPDIPLHFSAYHPAHRYGESPPTPRKTLLKLRDLALDMGCRRVYLGNLASADPGNG